MASQQQVVQSSQSSKTVVKSQQSFSSSSTKTVSTKSSSKVSSSSSVSSSSQQQQQQQSIGQQLPAGMQLALGAGGEDMEQRMQQMMQVANGKGGDLAAAGADDKLAAMMAKMGVDSGNGKCVTESYSKSESMKMQQVNDDVSVEGKKHEKLATSHGKGDFEKNEEFKESYDLAQGVEPIESTGKKQITTEPESEASNTKIKTAMTLQLTPGSVNQPVQDQ